MARQESAGAVAVRETTQVAASTAARESDAVELRRAIERAHREEPLASSGWIHVWDLPVRMMFFGLVVASAAAWYFARRDAGLHVIVGFAVAALVGARILWGIFGSRFARFSDFVFSPMAVVRHVASVFRFDARRYIGHDPLSGMLTLITLGLLSAIVATGWAMSAGVDGDAGWLRSVHLRATNALIVIVPFHILAALISGWMHGDNLLVALFGGWKRLDASDVLPAVVRTAELRLHDRMRAIEALAVMTLLSGAALGLGLLSRESEPRLPVVARTGAPPAPIASAPALSADERVAIMNEIGQQKAAVLRDVTAAKVEAERELAARARASEAETSTRVAGQIDKLREQMRTELFAELQKQQGVMRAATPVVPPSAPAASVAPAPLRSKSADEAVLRQVLTAGGSDRASVPAMISAGGRLYDNWAATLGKPAPTSTHPSWPQGRQAASAGDTWRCASCHGFDYRGDPGTARLGGAGVPFHSVRNAERMSIEQVVALLGDARHNFSDDILPRNSKIELGMFLVKGQYTAVRYFGADGRSRGAAVRGRERFVQACATCHGFDGRLAVKASGATLGAIAKDSPAEMFHKIRNGHPGAINAAMRPTPLSVQSDLLAYVQTLPR